MEESVVNSSVTETSEDEENKDNKLEELNATESKALTDNQHYWESRNLAFAGKLSDTQEFLPGNKVTVHTLDTAEQIYIGKVMDEEFGKITQFSGLPSSYDIGLKCLTLSLAIDKLNGEYMYSPVSAKEDAYNSDLSYHDRELALAKKSRAIRDVLHTWYPNTINEIYKCYRSLLERQDEAQKLLPFYSVTGQLLENSKYIENLGDSLVNH